MFTHTKDHRKALHATHICGFQVALKQGQLKMRRKHAMGFLPRQRAIYLASVQLEYNSPGQRQRSEARSLRQSRFARKFILVEANHPTIVACLDIKTIGIGVFFNCLMMSQ